MLPDPTAEAVSARPRPEGTAILSLVDEARPDFKFKPADR